MRDETAEGAETAVESVDGTLLSDGKVYVGHHVSRKERRSKIGEMRARFAALLVEDLDTGVAPDEFVELFSKFGTAVVRTDEWARSKGFGFADFESHERAARAVEDLHDADFP